MSLPPVFACMMVFLRAIGVVIQLPEMAGRPLPVTIRVALAFFLAVTLGGLVPVGRQPVDLWDLFAAAALEVVLGLALGFVVKMAFGAVEMGGRLIATEIGLNAGPGMGVPEPATEPVAGILSAFAIVLFFLFRADQLVLTAFMKSFQFAPAGAPRFSAAAGPALIEISAHVITLGVRIAAPFMAMNFLVTLAFSVLGRAVPKIQNVFVVSFSAKALIGLSLLAGAAALLGRYLFTEFSGTGLRMLLLLR